MRPSLRKYWILFGVAFCVVVAGSAALIAQAGRDDTPVPADAAKTAVPKKAPDKYLNLSEEEFDEVVQMLAEGFSTRRGRSAAHLHYDGVGRRIRARKP